ncbi:MAG: chloride channel protein, partial [Clostridia bacterium]|nr:chloride channel protein [Clostridia bacterium]
MNSHYHKEYLKSLFPCISFGILCGGLTGAVIFLFRLAAAQAEALSRFWYAMARLSLGGVLITFGALILAACAMALLHRRIPEVAGGGIPRSEGILRGVLAFRWFKTLLGTFFGSLLSFLCGLPVGSEGPSVLIGTSLGRFFSSLFKREVPWERYVMTGGAGAGFAIATGAPLSGILFALEEVHKRFTPLLIVTVSLSTLSATLVNHILCAATGISPKVFEIPALTSYRLQDTGYLLLFSLLIALSVTVFDFLVYLYNRVTKKIPNLLSAPIKLILLFLFSGVLAFFLTEGTYSGHDVIEELLLPRETVFMLLLLLGIRLCMMLLAANSSATGGLFIPSLAIGALCSALFARLLMVLGMSPDLYTVTMLLGMCAFLGGTLRAPLTATVFFLELTGQFIDLFFVALVVFIVATANDLVNLMPFYDRVIKRMERQQNEGKEAHITCFEMKISHGSFVIGKSVRDIMWPASSVIIGITRAKETNEDMDHDGEKQLFAEDTIVIRVRYYDEKELM